MTGLDQDMMQKNLTCKSLKDAQKYVLVHHSANSCELYFLILGLLLTEYAQSNGLDIHKDNLFPILAKDYLVQVYLFFFY